MTMAAFLRRFGTEDACRADLERIRWPDGPVCPRCGRVGHACRIATRNGLWACGGCRRQFTILVGTPMERTHLPLRSWFVAVYLLAYTSKGVSANKLKDLSGCSYEAAWYLGHRVRAMMHAGEAGLLRGVVEADDILVGGRERHGRDDAGGRTTPSSTRAGAAPARAR